MVIKIIIMDREKPPAQHSLQGFEPLEPILGKDGVP
jgi:hypothetical protein